MQDSDHAPIPIFKNGKALSPNTFLSIEDVSNRSGPASCFMLQRLHVRKLPTLLTCLRRTL